MEKSVHVPFDYISSEELDDNQYQVQCHIQHCEEIILPKPLYIIRSSVVCSQINQVPDVHDISLMHTADAKSISEEVYHAASSSNLSSPGHFTTIISDHATTVERGEKRKEHLSMDASIEKLPGVCTTSTKTDWNAQVKLIQAQKNTSKKKKI